MTSSKLYKRIAAFLTVFAMMFMLIPRISRTDAAAAGEKAVNLSNVRLLINGQAVTDETVIKDGAEVFFAFDWSVNKYGDEVLVNPLVADIDFTGIYLLANGGPLQQGGLNRGTYEIERTGTGNIIKFFVDDSQLKESNINGTAIFKGQVVYSGGDVGDDGKFEIKAQVDNAAPWVWHPSAEKTSNAWVNKAASGVLRKVGDKYYQDYTVTVNTNERNTVPYTINSIVDEAVTPGYTSLSGSISAAVTKGRASGYSASYSSFDQIKGITLAADSSITFSYTMEVSKDVIKNRYYTYPYGNKVKVNNSMESSASPTVPEVLVPYVSKYSSVDTANHKIRWTIEIGYKGFTGDPAHDKAMVIGIFDEISKDKLTGEQLVNTFNADDLWNHCDLSTIWGAYDQSGKLETRYRYTYTYETEYDDSNINVDRAFTNTFKATVDGISYERSETATVWGGASPLTKEFSGIDANGDLDWTIRFKVPENGTVQNLSLADSISADNGLSHVVYGSLNAVVNGGTYSGLRVSGSNVTVDSASGGAEIVVTLKTRITDDKIKAGKYYNNVSARYDLTVGSTTVPGLERSAGAQYERQNIVSKMAMQNNDLAKIDPNKYEVTGRETVWCVSLDLGRLPNPPHAGDVITLTDNTYAPAFPSADFAIKGFNRVHLGGNPWYAPDSDIITDSCLANGDVTFTDDTITVRLTQQMIDKNAIQLIFFQSSDDPDLAGSVNIKNDIRADFGGQSVGTASAEQNINISSGDILSKSSEADGAVVHYTIDVNRPGAKLGGKESTIQLDDQMGSKLLFQEGSLTVTGEDGASAAPGTWSSSYDKASGKLSLVLPDSGHYIVKYDVKLDVGYDIESQTYYVDGNKVTFDQIKDDLTNTAILKGAGGFDKSASDSLSAADVTGNVTIGSDFGDLVVNKFDSITREKLSGATFSLIPGRFIDGVFNPYSNTAAHSYMIDYTTGALDDTLFNGLEFKIVYELSETAAPADHKLLDSKRYIVLRKPGEVITAAERIAMGTPPSGVTIEEFITGETISIGNEPNDNDETPVNTVVNISKREVGGSAELPGARIRIVRMAGSADFTSESITVSGGGENIVRAVNTLEFTSGSTQTVITGMPAGTYRMVEDAAPAGYKKASSIEFVISTFPSTGTYRVTRNNITVADNTIVMEDEITEMTISKQDVFTNELPGAALTITGRDSDGNVIDLSGADYTGGAENFNASASGITFVSGSTPTSISGLPEGDYVLHEQAAPDGYIVAQDIRFSIDDRGRVRLPEGGAAVDNTLTMTDNRTFVIVKKSDISSEQPQIPGAAFEITNNDGADLSNVTVYYGRDVNPIGNHLMFTSTSREAEIRGLPKGRYTMVETYAPNGYDKVSSSFTFAVNEDGTVAGAGPAGEYDFDPITHKVTVKDKIKQYEVDMTLGLSITKADMANGAQQLEGAVLTISPMPDAPVQQSIDFTGVTVVNAKDDTFDNNGSSVQFITGSQTAAVIGLRPGYYVLTEDAAPGGYELTTNFYFQVIQDGTRISVVEGKGNGYNSLKTDAGGKVYVEIRDYLINVPEEPEASVTEPTDIVTATVSTVSVNESEENREDETSVGGSVYEQTTTTTPAVTVPGSNGSYPVGPSTGGVPDETGNRGPGYFIDPSVTNHIDRDNEPEISEDIKTGEGVSENLEREADNKGIIALAALTVISAAVFAVFRKHRREDGTDSR